MVGDLLTPMLHEIPCAESRTDESLLRLLEILRGAPATVTTQLLLGPAEKEAKRRGLDERS